MSGNTPDVEIPGTLVFDLRMSSLGVGLNRMSAALNDPAGRAAFADDAEAFMERFGLTDDQREAVRTRDFARMLQLGGNVYFVVKIGLVDGMSVADVASRMSGQTVDEYKQMMAQGGRKPHG